MRRNLPTGIQDFAKLRMGGQVYIDKTAYVWHLAQAGNPLFLARPRRFGKSLLLSTFKAYWEGRRDLFEGLDILALEDARTGAWASHAVFHLSFDGANYTIAGGLESKLNAQLRRWEKLWGTTDLQETLSDRLLDLIICAHEKTGSGVVVLIDEYDKPLLDVMEDSVLLAHNREVLRGFYGALKESDEHLRFLFVTGVTRFSKVSIFSEFNNLDEISLSADYAGICGITETELRECLAPEVEAFARARCLTLPEAYRALAARYDGYCFHPDGPDADGAERVYNPYSLMRSLKERRLGSFWFRTGTPTFLVRRVRSSHLTPREFAEADVYVDAERIEDYLVDDPDPVPLLFQAGYLTIRGWDEGSEAYRLGIPNVEVKRGLFASLLADCTGGASLSGSTSVTALKRHAEAGDADGMRDVLRALFAHIPYTSARDGQDPFENYFMAVIYITFLLLGTYVTCETHVATGRADVIVECTAHVWVMELKRDGTAAEALAQIEEKGYAARYAADARVLHKVGCSFSSKTRLMADWLAV